MSLHMFSLPSGDGVQDLGGSQVVSNVQWHLTAIGPLVSILDLTNPKRVIREGWVGLGGYTGLGALQYIAYWWYFNFEYEFFSLPTPNIECFTWHLSPGSTADIWLNW